MYEPIRTMYDKIDYKREYGFQMVPRTLVFSVPIIHLLVGAIIYNLQEDNWSFTNALYAWYVLP